MTEVSLVMMFITIAVGAMIVFIGPKLTRSQLFMVWVPSTILWMLESQYDGQPGFYSPYFSVYTLSMVVIQMSSLMSLGALATLTCLGW